MIWARWKSGIGSDSPVPYRWLTLAPMENRCLSLPRARRCIFSMCRLCRARLGRSAGTPARLASRLQMQAGMPSLTGALLSELDPHRLWDNTCFVGSFEQQFYSLTASVTVVNRVVVYVHPDKRIGQRFRHTAAVLHRVTHSDLTVL